MTSGQTNWKVIYFGIETALKRSRLFKRFFADPRKKRITFCFIIKKENDQDRLRDRSDRKAVAKAANEMERKEAEAERERWLAVL